MTSSTRECCLVCRSTMSRLRVLQELLRAIVRGLHYERVDEGMKLNPELVVKILTVLEEHPHGYAPSPFVVEGYSVEEVGFHLYLMLGEELIEGRDSSSHDHASPMAMVTNITMKGYGFLGDSRPEPVWKKALEVFKALGSGSLGKLVDIVTEVGKGYVQEELKKRIGPGKGSS